MPNNSLSSGTAQADKTDYLLSALCVLCVLNVVPMALTVIVAVFWIKKYQLPFAGEGFSIKMDGKKILQILLLALSGSMLGVFSMGVTFSGLPHLKMDLILGNLAGGDLIKGTFISAIEAFVVVLAFCRCLYSEWSKFGILPSIIGLGIVYVVLSPLSYFPGALILGLASAVIYEMTHCAVMTALFHFAFLLTRKMIVLDGAQTPKIGITLTCLVVGLVLIFVFAKLSGQLKTVMQKIKIQQQHKISHPYILKPTWCFWIIIMVMYQVILQRAA